MLQENRVHNQNRFREYAIAMREQADCSSGPIRDYFLGTAASWDKLADSVDFERAALQSVSTDVPIRSR
jgi:hypothetical protein